MQFMVLQICSFNRFQSQVYQPIQPVVCPLQIQPDFLQLLPRLFQQRKNPQQRLISPLFMVWYKIENQSLSLSPLSPHQGNDTEYEIINILICFKTAMEEVEESGNVKISFPALRNDKFIDLEWEPKNLLLLFDF